MSSRSNGAALLDTWATTTTYMLNSAVAANRAMIGSAGGDSADDVGASNDRIKAGESLPEWHTELSEDDPEALGIGDSVEFTKTVTEADVRAFATVSGDTNPLHLDADYAETTQFRECLIHGVLVGSLVSAALARLPGLVVYLSQDFEFHAPAYPGDRLTATIQIVENLGDGRYRLVTMVTNDDEKTIIDGEAIVLAGPHPDSAQ